MDLQLFPPSSLRQPSNSRMLPQFMTCMHLRYTDVWLTSMDCTSSNGELTRFDLIQPGTIPLCIY